MNNNILNEIKTIKKMMGLILEQSQTNLDFTSTTPWGLTSENSNNFIKIATTSGNNPFMFNGVIYKLEQLSDPAVSEKHKTVSFNNENMVYNIGLLSYTQDALPIIIKPDISNAFFETFPNGAKGGSDIVIKGGYNTPNDLKKEFANSFSRYKTTEEKTKVAKKNFEDSLAEMSSIRNDIKQYYGDKLKERYNITL